MKDKASITSLRERVEKAPTGSRQLDFLIHGEFYGEVVLGRKVVRGGVTPPDYTTSIDIALALAERILPGWTWTITWWPPSDAETGFTRCTLGGPGYISDDSTADEFEVTLPGDKPKEALAVCASLLQALEGKQP